MNQLASESVEDGYMTTDPLFCPSYLPSTAEQ
jgi:hypothetical protein